MAKGIYLNEHDNLKEAEMEGCRKELWFEVFSRRAFVDTELQAEACIGENRIEDGVPLCNADHISIPVLRQEIFI